LARAKTILDNGVDPRFHEGELDRRYLEIAHDQLLAARFEKHLVENPFEYAPLRTTDME
jgi:hypothetical protein